MLIAAGSNRLSRPIFPANPLPTTFPLYALSLHDALPISIPVLLGVATLVFSLIHLIPGDPAQAMLGESASPAPGRRGRSEEQRLNSSHVEISYAVFCLKKKKNDWNDDGRGLEAGLGDVVA